MVIMNGVDNGREREQDKGEMNSETLVKVVKIKKLEINGGCVVPEKRDPILSRV